METMMSALEPAVLVRIFFAETSRFLKTHASVNSCMRSHVPVQHSDTNLAQSLPRGAGSAVVSGALIVFR